MTHPSVPTPRSGRLHAGGPNQLELVWATLLLVVVAAGTALCALIVAAVNLDHLAAGSPSRTGLGEVAAWLAAGDLHALAGLADSRWRAASFFVVLLAVALAVTWRAIWWWADRQAGSLHRRRAAERTGSRVWATRRQLRPLLAPAAPRPADEAAAAGRLLIGTHHHRDVLAPARTSVMAIAPTRTGKSTRLVVPNLLRWDGPAVVTSVKRDVYDLTAAHRADSYGPVHLFDPTGSTGLTGVRWSPLLTSTTFPDATRTATWLADAAAVEDNHTTAKFWDTLATKLLAPLLYAAARTGQTIHQVSHWVDRSDFDEVARILHSLGDVDAQAAWQAITDLPPETRGSVLGTAMAIFRGFGSPRVKAATSCTPGDTTDTLNIPQLLTTGGTLYLVAPEYEQAELRPVFVALVQAVYRAAVDLSANLLEGAPLNPPLLLMLDEAGNIAPLKALPKIASTGAGQGITLMTIWQDRAQIRQLYGDAERTVIANHTTSVWLPGSQDLDTLKLLADLIGDQWVASATVSAAADGGLSVSQGTERIDVAPPAFLRTLTHGQAVMLSGNLPPALIDTHAYYDQPRWRTLIPPDQLQRHHRMHTAGGPTTAATAKQAGLDLTLPGPASPATPTRPAAAHPSAIAAALHARYPTIEAARDVHRTWGATAAVIPLELSTEPKAWADVQVPGELLHLLDLPLDLDVTDPTIRRPILAVWLEVGPATSINDQLTLPQLTAEWPHLPITTHICHVWEDCYPALTGHDHPDDPEADADQAVAS